MNISNTLSFTDFMLYLLIYRAKTGAKVGRFCEVYLHNAQKCDYIVEKTFIMCPVLNLNMQ